MSPLLHNKILKYINREQIHSITIDVFDTLLLNDYWPSDLRYHDLARKWLTTLHDVISPKITTYEITTWRDYAKRDLTEKHQPLRLDLWIDTFVNLLCVKYDIKLQDEQHLQLLATLISTEITFTLENVKPNHALISQLQKVKVAYPDIKLYFVSDTHFSTLQIEMMLDILNIRCFDGGVTSSDLDAPLENGDFYEQLGSELSSQFKISQNLHIGDHRIPDYLTPILHDGYAIHYRPIRARGLRTMIGKIAFKTIQILAVKREIDNFYYKFPYHASPSNLWEQYGVLLAQADAIYANKLDQEARQHLHSQYLLVGNESFRLAEQNLALFDNENLKLAGIMNETTMIEAFLWLLATYRSPRWNAGKLAKILLAKYVPMNRAEIYNFCFAPDYAVSELAITSRDEDEFWEGLIEEIASADRHYTDHLRESYNEMSQFLPQNQQDLYCITFKSDGTVDIFREFARLHGVSNDIYEWNINADLQLSRQERQLSVKINPRRQKLIDQGRRKGIRELANTELAPDHYLQAIITNQIKRLSKQLG